MPVLTTRELMVACLLGEGEAGAESMVTARV